MITTVTPPDLQTAVLVAVFTLIGLVAAYWPANKKRS